jgi:hypothetical protein
VGRKLTESKREAFQRLAERRTDAVLEKLRILANCANPYSYQWTDGDLDQIFAAITREVEVTRQRFEAGHRPRQRFKLRRAQPAPAEGRGTLAGDSQPAGSASTAANRNGLIVKKVAGREKSQIAIEYVGAPGWHVLAKDRGHRKGYQLLLFGPTAAVEHAAETGPGTLRADAIQHAEALLKRSTGLSGPPERP